MSGFKIPESVPQDLLLIQEMVDIPPPAPKFVQKMDEESSSGDISSSDSEDEGENSEDEIEANLVMADNDDSDPAPEKNVSEPAHSDSDSSSDSEPEDDPKKPGDATVQDGMDDDEEGPAIAAGTVPATKHEIVEADIAIPEVDQLDPTEQIEKVGEIMTVFDQVAIVRGLPSENMSRGSQKALDSDTLLVFDDRTVMGYIFETFGPTAQPLYQVKYSSKYPLNPERVRVSREVFSAPSKSKFVFVDQIKAFKGSDASNVYDEEPGDDELEFSDDEAEAAYKSRMKRKRGESRARSVASSREPTPNPSRMRDHELMEEAMLSRNPYDEHGPYDLDYSGAGPSRPAPIPYDDPYATPSETTESEPAAPIPPRAAPRPPPRDSRPRGRGRGGNFGQNSRGRGGGRGGGFNHESRRGGSEHVNGGFHSEAPQNQPAAYNAQAPAPAHEMGPYFQDYNQMGYQGMPQQQSWGYPSMGGMMQPQFGGQNPGRAQGMPFVQPHINPLFAPSFGFNAMNQGYGQYGMGDHSSYGSEYSSQQHQPQHQQQSQQQWAGQWPPSSNNQHPSSEGQGRG